MRKVTYKEFLVNVGILYKKYSKDNEDKLTSLSGLDLAVEVKHMHSMINTSLSRLLMFNVSEKVNINSIQADAINILLSVANKTRDIPCLPLVLNTKRGAVLEDMDVFKQERKPFTSFYPDTKTYSISVDQEVDNVLGYYGVDAYKHWLLLGIAVLISIEESN